MKRGISRRSFVLAAAAAASMSAVRAAPGNTVRLVIPIGPGAGGDAFARFFANQLADILGQPVIVDNRPGADALLAVQELLQSPPDGRTLMMISPSSMVSNPLIRRVPYEPLRDIRPLITYNRYQGVFLSAAESTLRTVQGVVTAARANPGVVSVGTYGLIYRLGVAELELRGGLKFNQVNYKTPMQTTTDLAGGHVDLALMDLAGSLPLIRSGKLHAIATTGESRSVDIPGTPTVSESGFPGYARYGWNGWGVRADTPEPIAAKLEAALQKVITSPEYKAFNAANGNAEITGLDRKQVEQLIASETRVYRKLLTALGELPP